MNLYVGCAKMASHRRFGLNHEIYTIAYNVVRCGM